MSNQRSNSQLNAAVLERYRAGESYGAIGAAFGLSRNSVAGIVHRSGTANRGGAKLPFRDLTDERFGRWTVIQRGRDDHRGNKHWWCRCDCQAWASVKGSALVAGRSKSCGCLRNEDLKARHAATRLQKERAA